MTTAAATLTERREHIRAQGIDVPVDLNIYDMGTGHSWEIPCALCSQPARLAIGADQQAGQCPTCQRGDTPRPGVVCLDCNIDCGSTDDYA